MQFTDFDPILIKNLSHTDSKNINNVKSSFIFNMDPKTLTLKRL